MVELGTGPNRLKKDRSQVDAWERDDEWAGYEIIKSKGLPILNCFIQWKELARQTVHCPPRVLAQFQAREWEAKD